MKMKENMNNKYILKARGRGATRGRDSASVLYQRTHTL